MVSIAVVTKRRPKSLRRLLDSIVAQTLQPTSVIIIDNDPELSARSVVKFYMSKLPISYYVEKKQGVPHARNLALEKVETEYIAFIDDDCVLSRSWYKNAQKAVKVFPKAAYIIGKSRLLNQLSPVAQAQHRHQMYWFENKLKGRAICTPFNVDTKNIVLNVSQLKKYEIYFDTEVSIGWFDSADTDLGFQMERAGLLGIYVPQLQLFHKETETLKYFLKKGYYRGKLASKLAQKWHVVGEFVYLPFRSWWKYFKSVRFWKKEFYWYYEKISLFSLISFICLKLYERVFFFGYLSEE